MHSPIPVAELRVRGVELEPHEAVAIVQRLIERCGDRRGDSARIVELRVGSLALTSDGEIVRLGPAAVPTVEAAATLLQQLLPVGARRVPAGLRYDIARALHEVQAPPFESVDRFSHTIARFEKGERAVVLRTLAARVFAEASPVAAPSPVVAPASTEPRRVERRGPHVVPAEVRRELREADLKLYYAQKEPPRPAARWNARRVLRRAAPAAAALLFLAAIEYGRLSRSESGEPRTAGITVSPKSEPRDTPAPQVGEKAGVPSTTGVPPQTETAADRRASVSQPAQPAPYSAVPTASAQLVRAVDRRHPQVFSPAFDTGGAAILFHSGGNSDPRSALMAASDVGGELRVRTLIDDGSRNYHVRPSPDGRLIAFDSDRDGERGVYIANRDGSNVRRVSGTGHAAVPSWAPDGKRLAFVRAEPSNPKVWNQWLLSLESGELRRLTRFRYGQTWGGSWFPDGRRIAITHEDRLIVMDLSTGRSRTYRSPVAGRLVRTAAVAPDGWRVIFQVRRSGVWMLDLRTHSMERVLNDASAEEFAWSPDGRRVAFHSRRDGQWAIWTMPAGGTD